jgi:hypothetical protein
MTVQKKILLIGILLAIIIAMPVMAALNITHFDDGKTLLSNGSLWIQLDPISDTQQGTPLYICGTTNLPVGSQITGGVKISEDPTLICRTKTCYLEYYSAINKTLVQSGNISQNINTFSIFVDTKYLLAGNLFNSSVFSDIGIYTDDRPVKIYKKNIKNISSNVSDPSSISHNIPSKNQTELSSVVVFLAVIIVVFLSFTYGKR